MASKCRISISIKHIQVTETLLATSVSNASPKLASVTLPCSVAWRGDRPDPSQHRFERNRIERAVVYSDRDTNGDYDSSIKLEVATSTRELHVSKVKSDEADETTSTRRLKIVQLHPRKTLPNTQFSGCRQNCRKQSCQD